MSVAQTDKPAKIEVIENNIPEELKPIKRWVTWDWQWSVKYEKWTKPPFQGNRNYASVDNPKTWMDFNIALLLGRSRGGVGFVLGKDVGVVGVDFDDCRNPVTGEIEPLKAEVIRKFNTYVEVSPSGKGVKLLCRGTLPPNSPSKNEELGIEIYDEMRYFTLTGHVLPGYPKKINESQAMVNEIMTKFMPLRDADLPRPEMATEEEEIELAKNALQAIDSSMADGYTDWLMIGMALHSISPYLLDEWDRWSASSPKYAPGECANKWKGFDGQGVRAGTLYHFAKMRGWAPPKGWKKAKINRKSMIVENYHREIQQASDGSERMIKVAHPQPMIVKSIYELFDGWPKRLGSQLFVTNGKKIEYLMKPANLFSWMRESKDVVWGSGDEMTTKEEIHISLSRTAQEFSDIQESPHFPPIEGIYYHCETPKAGDGKHLKQLLDCFAPETNEDRQLILAAIATTFWGGPPGQRPAFLISNSKGSSQGIGKTSLASMIGDLSGGMVAISPDMDVEEIKRRLLSGTDSTRRVIFVDNIKKQKFSDSGIESLMTAADISGHRMFVGPCSRPNLLTWILTMNDPSLSRDLAQRCINIELRRPKHSGRWIEETAKFIKSNRSLIIGDLAEFFARERKPIDYPSRWSLWESEIISRLDDPSSVCTLIRARETKNDDDEQQAKLIEEYIKEKMEEAEYTHPMRVHISINRLSTWVNDALGDDTRGGVRKAIATLSRFESSGILDFLSKNPTRKYGRGWVYSTGDDSMNIRYDLEQRII